MPTIRAFSPASSLILFVSLLFFSASGFAQQAHSETSTRAGIAKLVKGKVSIGSSVAERALASGDPINAADTVYTGPDSAASMVLRDGTVMVLGANSRMELKNFAFDATTYEGNVAVALMRGTMRMITGLVGKTRHDAVQVNTPTALIGIRGTDFIVEVDDDGASR